MNAPRQIHALEHVFIPQKAHINTRSGTHCCTHTSVQDIITPVIPPADVNMPTAFVNHPVSYTRCQSSSSLTSHHGVQSE